MVYPVSMTTTTKTSADAVANDCERCGQKVYLAGHWTDYQAHWHCLSSDERAAQVMAAIRKDELPAITCGLGGCERPTLHGGTH